MSTMLIVLVVLTASLLALPAMPAEPAGERWSAEKANTWYERQPWPCGFNYVPANSISYTEMWLEYAFDATLIDKELALAQDTGLNCIRVVLPYVVWEGEPEAFKKRLDAFAGICSKRGLKVMFALFDDCKFGAIEDPVFGRQPEVVPGWYANGWTPSPGWKMVRDRSAWPKLEKYVTDVIRTFKDDPRVWVWDLYNEPTNGIGDVSLPLVEQVVAWARAVNPTQPLTVGIWNGNGKLNDLCVRFSDVVTFHNYGDAAAVEKHIADLKKHGRPVINTEWMNRGQNSVIATCLPVFHKARVGCMLWGLVNGKTQTNLNWGHRPGQPDPKVWQHDLFRGDFKPYDPTEIETLKQALRAK